MSKNSLGGCRHSRDLVPWGVVGIAGALRAPSAAVFAVAYCSGSACVYWWYARKLKSLRAEREPLISVFEGDADLAGVKARSAR